LNSTEQIFTQLGGIFCRPFAEIEFKLNSIRAFIFDWDGVFNDGMKSAVGGSPFSEVDAMGTNMLRFGYFLKNQSVPKVAILTGEENPAAAFLGNRECFHGIYFKSTDKRLAFRHFLSEQQLKAEEVAFVFDDVLDLAVAEQCGLRFQVRHAGAPLLQKYSKDKHIADYITATETHAVREVCELILGIFGRYNDAIYHRSQFDETYQKYLTARNQVTPVTWMTKDGIVVRNG
jgi:3-deoxy-D-manno-octulosonate 8-phosphate phosphatase (KDO 8-P phosphatase)